MLDVLIVGGGPAGLSAALILGRCCRRVLLCDTGRPRNARSPHLHGYLTRDGSDPVELRHLGRTQLARYHTIELRDLGVRDVVPEAGGFTAALEDGSNVWARKLLLATGVTDRLPPVQGAEVYYGRGLFHCPYCDGWEVRDQVLVALGRGEQGKSLALELKGWSGTVVLCSDGDADLEAQDRQRLARNRITVREERIATLEGDGVFLQRIRFADGGVLDCGAVFFASEEGQGSELPERLGCGFTRRGAVDTDAYEGTRIPGVYVAGDASRSVQLAIIAASEGARAAFAINTELLKEDLA